MQSSEKMSEKMQDKYLCKAGAVDKTISRVILCISHIKRALN